MQWSKSHKTKRLKNPSIKKFVLRKLKQYWAPKRIVGRLKYLYKINISGSDIDFAIWTDAHDKFTAIRWELDALPTPYMLDVTDYKALTHEGIKKSIDTDGKLFYQRQDG